MEAQELIEKINSLKKKKKAVLLVHNYQRPEIYKVADYIGDSLELSRQAAAADAAMIVFCGVRFMAETAKILSPGKKVLLPNPDAGCSLADMATQDSVLELKKKHPGAAVVSYVNTNADVKAVSDICCTSANAVAVVNSLKEEEVIFLPDKNLGSYVQARTTKKIILWDGYCAVHRDLGKANLAAFKKAHPGAKVIAHPECTSEVLEEADYVCGTGGMASYAARQQSKEFIVVTECGMTARLSEDVPDKSFFSFCNLCSFMKATTLEHVLHSLEEEETEINLPESVMNRARTSILKMLEAA